MLLQRDETCERDTEAMKELTWKMRQPRRGKPLGLSTAAWYYVGPASIDVFSKAENGPTTTVRLTRRQLLLALRVMEAAK